MTPTRKDLDGLRSSRLLDETEQPLKSLGDYRKAIEAGPARGYGQVGPWPDLKKFQNITRLLDRLDSGLIQANETFC